MFSADLGGYTPSLPAATDPPFQKVALLLHGDGTNGAQNNTFVDYSYPGGYAVSFDGTGDYLSVASNTGLNFGSGDFTVEFWCYSSIAFVTGGQQNIIASGGTSFTTDSTRIGKDFNSGMSLYANNGAGVILSEGNNTSFVPNVWNHYAFTRSGTSLKMFRNGVSIATATSSANINLNQGSSTVIGVTGWSKTSVDYWNGYISNLRVVKGTALYTSNFTPSNQPLTAVSGTQLLTCQSATIVDNSPNAFTITANGNAAAVSSKTITRTGNVAQGTFSPFSLAEGQWSNYFDGSGDYLRAPSSSAFAFGTSDFCIEGWFYYTSASGSANLGPTLYDAGNANSAGSLWFGWYNDTLYFRIDGTSNDLTASITRPRNTWTHIAATRSGGTVRLFVNGSIVASGTRNQSVTQQYPYIGFNPNGGSSSYMEGYFSNVRVVSGSAIYTSAFTPSTTPLTAISGTSLLTCQSNRFKDNSSNNFTITPAGDTKVTAFSPFAPSAAYSASTNGGSAYFDGSGDYLTVPSSTSLQVPTEDFTIEAFVYITTLTGTQTILQKGIQGTSTFEYGFYYDTGSLRFYSSVNGSALDQYSVTFAPIANQWNHFAVTRSGTSVKFFANGVQVGSTTIGYSTLFAGSGAASIGMNSTGTVNPLYGYLSNVRFVKGSLVYTGSYTVPTSALTAITNTQLLLNCTNAGIIDNAGKNDIETVGNAQISTSVKKYGTGSMYFDGTGDWLAIPSSTEFDVGGGDFTIECWVYASSTQPAYAGLVSRQGSGGVQIIMGSGGTTVEAWGNLPTGTRLAASSTTVTNSNWHHIALVRNGSSFKIYVDGVAGSTTLTNSTAFVAGTAPLYIGYDTGGSTRVFNGYIDDLRITKGQALYTSNFTPPTQAFPNV